MALRRKKAATKKTAAKKKTVTKKKVAKKVAPKKAAKKAVAKKTVRTNAAPIAATRKKARPTAKRKSVFQKILTAEGWKRLMMGAKK